MAMTGVWWRATTPRTKWREILAPSIPKCQTCRLFSSLFIILNPSMRASVASLCSSSSKPLAMAGSEANGNGVQVPVTQNLHQNGACDGLVPLLRVKKLSEKAVLPSRASPLSAGFDISSATETKVPARGKALVPTDLSISIPEGTYARIAPRSGLAWKHSIDVGAGVIDADYRGPVGVVLFNHSDADFDVKIGDRIAQLILEKIMTPDVLQVEDLGATVRGSGGFGSTGV